MRAFLLCFPPVLFPTLDHLVLSSIIHHVVSVKSNLPLRTSDLNRGDCLHKWERADYLPLPPGFTFVPAFNRCPYVIKQDFAEGKVCSKEVFQLLVLFHFCFLELEKFTKWFHRVPLNSNEIGTQKSQLKDCEKQENLSLQRRWMVLVTQLIWPVTRWVTERERPRPALHL